MPWSLLVARLLLIGAALGIAVLSLLPPEQLPADVSVSDKLIHAAGYGLLGALAVLSGFRPSVTFVSVLGFGLLLEVAQLASGYRAFEWGDLLADGVGAGLGVALVAGVRRPGTRTDESG